jgi:hypothetical protein
MPQAGLRVSHFDERGSDLALHFNRLSQTNSSALAGVDISLDAQPLNGWTIMPAITLSYELALGDPRVESAGSLYEFPVQQYSAYDSRYLVKGSLGVAARHDGYTVKAEASAVHGDGSNGVDGQLSIAYLF